MPSIRIDMASLNLWEIILAGIVILAAFIYVVRSVVAFSTIVVPVLDFLKKRRTEAVDEGYSKGATDTKIENLETSVKELKNDVKELSRKFDDYLFASDSVIKSQSSRALSKLGEKVSMRMKAKDIAASLAPNIEIKIGMSRYAVQRLSFEYVQNHYQPDAATVELMEQCVYDEGIGIFSNRNVIAIELRDLLLNQMN